MLDVLGGGGLAENLAMLADDGRLVVIGMQQGRRGELDLSVLLAKRASILGTMLRSRPLEQKVAIMDGVRRHAWPFVEDRWVRPVVHARLGFDQAADAHRLLESGEAFGKVLLIPLGRPHVERPRPGCARCRTSRRTTGGQSSRPAARAGAMTGVSGRRGISVAWTAW